jgi:hypothetical protein
MSDPLSTEAGDWAVALERPSDAIVVDARLSFKTWSNKLSTPDRVVAGSNWSGASSLASRRSLGRAQALDERQCGGRIAFLKT